MQDVLAPPRWGPIRVVLQWETPYVGLAVLALHFAHSPPAACKRGHLKMEETQFHSESIARDIPERDRCIPPSRPGHVNAVGLRGAQEGALFFFLFLYSLLFIVILSIDSPIKHKETPT